MRFECMNDAEITVMNKRIIMQAQKGTNLFNGVSGTWKSTNFPYY